MCGSITTCSRWPASSAVAGVAAYLVRNLINPNLLIPRILVVGIVTAAIYLPRMYCLALPGWEMLSREKIRIGNDADAAR